MGALDGFVVTIAVPSIHADLGATFGQTQIIVAGYGTVFAVGLGIGARLGDRYGHRRLFCIGMTIFVAASATCGAAPGPMVLIGARLIQGIGAAATLPQVLSIIRSAFPAHERSVAIGWYGATVGLGVVCGPALGGLLIAADLAGLGWRWVFLINIPLGLAVLVGAALVVPETRDHAREAIDLIGTGLAAVGLGALLVPLTQGPQAGWPLWMMGCLIVGPALLMFITYERRLDQRHATPLLPLRRLFLRYGRRVLVAGVTLVIGGLGSIVVTDAAIAASNRPAAFVPVLLLSGIGQGLTNNPLITLVMSGVDQRDAGVASGVYLTTGELGNALGLALFGSIFLVLLTGDDTGADPVAFSRALRWTVSLLAIAMTCALLSVRPLRPEPNGP